MKQQKKDRDVSTINENQNETKESRSTQVTCSPFF